MNSILKVGVLALLVSVQTLLAHTALMSCVDNGDGTIMCEGGFSDGSSATGVKVKVVQAGKTLEEKKFDKNSEATFKKPSGEYKVIFDGGEGHTVEIDGKKILN
ncbi:MAG: hypothetical protein ACTTH5_06360 [Wolinella sp.]